MDPGAEDIEPHEAGASRNNSITSRTNANSCHEKNKRLSRSNKQHYDKSNTQT